MEKLLKLLKEQNSFLDPNDSLSRMISECDTGKCDYFGEIDLDDLDLVAAAQKIPDFVPHSSFKNDK